MCNPDPPRDNNIQEGKNAELKESSGVIASKMNPDKQQILQMTAVIFGPCLSMNSPTKNREPTDVAKPTVEISAKYSFCLELTDTVKIYQSKYQIKHLGLKNIIIDFVLTKNFHNCNFEHILLPCAV